MKAILFFTIIWLIHSCSGGQKKAPSGQKHGVQDSIVVIKKAYENNPGATEYEIPVFRGTNMRHGIQKRYYVHGSVYSEIPYTYGKKNGNAYTYYQAALGAKPVIWKEQPYVNDTLHGTCRRFHRDGRLQAEYEYNKGLPGTGLREFNESGNPVALPKLILNKSKTGEYYFITARLDKKMKEVNYYLGPLVEGKYFPSGLKGLQVKGETGEILVPVTAGKVTVTAVFFTKYGNQAIISSSIVL